MNPNAQELFERDQIWSAPDPLEEAFLKQQMADTQAKMAAIDSQNLVSQAQISALQQRKLELEAELTHWKSQFSPIRRLPPDLLIEVFQHLDFETKLTLQPAQSQAVWSNKDLKRVSSVCTCWHTLVYSIPQFWSKFRVETSCSNQGAALNPKELHKLQSTLYTLLDRSSSAPLTIHISALREWSSISDILSPLLKQAHRWKSLHMQMSSRHFTDAGFQCLEGSFDCLESLIYEDIARDSDRITRSAHKWFSNARCLRKVVEINTHLEAFDLPWAQLQSLALLFSLDAPSAKHIRALELSTSLRSLEVHCEPLRTPLECAHVPLHIESLTISDQEDMVFFENYFKLPSLIELKIRRVDASISSFLAQVAPTLQLLTFSVDTSEDFPLSFLGPHTPLPELRQLIVTIRDGSGGGEDSESADSEAALDSLKIRFPRLAQFKCQLEGSTVDERLVYVWASVVSQFKENQGEAMSALLDVRGPIRNPSFSSVIPLFGELLLKGIVIGIRLRRHYLDSKDIHWRLGIEDVVDYRQFGVRQDFQVLL